MMKMTFSTTKGVYTGGLPTNKSGGRNSIINSYASQNPTLFGSGIGISTPVPVPIDPNHGKRANMKSMITRLSGLRPGCGSCRGNAAK